MRRVALICALAGAALLAGCSRKPAPGPVPAPGTQSPPPLFVEMAAQSGIDFTHVSGATPDFLLPEIMGGGAGFLDFDGDGLLDVYLVQSGALGRPDRAVGNRLYRNAGGGGFVDVTASAAVGDSGYGMGCASGDYDDDGDVDLYVTNLGADVLYRNDGAGSFTDVTSDAGIAGAGWSTSAAFVDYDGDGDLDLFVTSYVLWSAAPRFTERECFAATGEHDYCSPQAYDAPSPDTLYENVGEGRFRDVSVESGVARRAGTGLGVVCTDLDGDGRIDVYIANDQMPSFAWINRGDGTFEERAALLGIAVDEHGRAQAGMGVDVADVDRDGDFDLWKVHLDGESHILHLRTGAFYDDATVRFGLALPTRPSTGFGTGFLDADLDGRLDLFVANGRVQRSSDGTSPHDDAYAEANQILLQTLPGRFEDAGSRAGMALARVATSRAAAFGDYDEDGDVDVLVVNRDGPVSLLRNEAAPRRFLTVRVLEPSGRDAEGAVVQAIGDGFRYIDTIRAAYGYCATNDPRINIGLPAGNAVDRLEITWPDGAMSVHADGPHEGFVVVRRLLE